MTGELDLSRFAAAYRADGQGQAPYDPAMMLGLLFYCYFKGIRSSRKIKQACVDDLGCRVICGGAVPSHRAVAEFLRRHRGEVKRLFVQVLGLLAAAGAIDGHCAAVDGSPVSGNASRFANLDAGQLAAKIAALEAAIEAEAEAWLAGAEQADGAGQQPLRYDDDDDDDDDGGGGGAAAACRGGWPRWPPGWAGCARRRTSSLSGRWHRRAARKHRSPARSRPLSRRAAAGAGRGRPGRRDGEIPRRGGGRETLAVRQDPGPGRSRTSGSPGCASGPRARRPGWPPPGTAPPRCPRPRSRPPTRTPGCCRPRTAAATPRAGTWSWPPPGGRSCSPSSCTTTPPTPAP